MRGVRPRAALVDCTNLLRLARIVKTADEISVLRKAATIAEVAAAEGLAALADSDRVSDAVDRFHLSLVAEGAIPDHFAFGADGIGLSTDVGARLSMNKPFFVDFGCVYRRYYSDAGLTAVRGRCSGEALSAYRNVVACIQSGVDKLGPGVAASEVQEVMAAAASTSGLRGSFPHGHGVGLEVRDYPILVPSNRRRIRDGTVDVTADVPLEPGMVINLEVGYFSPHRYSMQYETTHQITEDGAVPLTDQRRDEPLVC
jgi:Xaa-Pro aminopeptidase